MFKKIKFASTILALIVLSACDLSEKPTIKTPLAPSNLKYSVTSNKLVLTWQDNSDNEIQFNIERKSDEDNDWKTVWISSANETSYEMNVFQVAPNPAFRVRAWSTSGESEPSNTVYVPTYASAELMIYICPNFYDGCNSNYIVIDQNCRPIQGVITGEWYNTGFLLTTNHDYALQFCGGCISDCGAAIAFQTPKAFLTTTYYSTIYGYCQNPCTPPASTLK
ncbi:MAG: fibronectin type III domain-containing protein [Bacteroidales bacterium]|nr:fibronectin type III domain-containing protein [Bacteroidales bacterium]